MSWQFPLRVSEQDVLAVSHCPNHEIGTFPEFVWFFFQTSLLSAFVLLTLAVHRKTGAFRFVSLKAVLEYV